MDSEDKQCLMEIAQGNQDALNRLYFCYYQRLYRYLWYQLHGDGLLVEEALQDTFLSVWRAANTFRGEARVVTWLFRIAQRCASHVQRPRSRYNEVHSLSLQTIAESYDTPFSQHEDRTLTRLSLQSALTHLSSKHREVVLLIFVHGFTSEEAANILGVPAGTVRSRLRAARVLLINDPTLQQSEGASS